MMQMQGGGPQVKMPQQQAQQQVAVADVGGTAAPVAIARREGGVLSVSAGMDPSIVMSKIKEIAAQIIGDDEDIEVDTPLMQAGLTSNTAVMLRDELGKDI